MLPDEPKILKRAKAGSKPDIDKLALHYLERAKRACRIHAGRKGLDYADADSEAYFVILEAIETYKPEKGASFATWIGTCARGSITRASRESQRQGQIPRPSKLRATPKPDAPDAEGADQRHGYAPSNTRPKAEIPEESDGLVDAFLNSGGTIKKIPPALPQKELPPPARHTSATKAPEPALTLTAQDKELKRDRDVALALDGLCSWWRREWLNRVKGSEEERRDRKIAELLWVKEAPRKMLGLFQSDTFASLPYVEQMQLVYKHYEEHGRVRIRCHTRAEAAEILGISERVLNRRRTAIIHEITGGMTEDELLGAKPGRARWSTPTITEIPWNAYSHATEEPLPLAALVISAGVSPKTTNIV